MTTFIGSLPPSDKRAPVGECVYSLGANQQHGGKLTSEHIIADGLGGKVELPEASCPACCDITSRIEGQCLRRMFQHARQLLNLRLRKPQSYRVARTSERPRKESDWVEVEEHQYPLFLPFEVYDRPGLLTGRPKSRDFAPRAHQMFAYAQGLYNVGDTVWANAEFNSYLFGQMLAKIAHAAAVAILGKASFDAMLPDIIVRADPFLSSFIGSPDGDVKPVLSIQDVNDEGDLHEVSIVREQDYFIAEVGLFARLGFHPYEVVVGRARR